MKLSSGTRTAQEGNRRQRKVERENELVVVPRAGCFAFTITSILPITESQCFSIETTLYWWLAPWASPWHCTKESFILGDMLFSLHHIGDMGVTKVLLHHAKERREGGVSLSIYCQPKLSFHKHCHWTVRMMDVPFKLLKVLSVTDLAINP